jgi:dTMP kinase
LGAKRVEELCRVATGGLEPDLTILTRVDPDVAAGRGNEGDRFEAEGVDLQRSVADAYDAIAAANPRRIAVVDGEGAIEEVHESVMAVVRDRMSR